MDIKEYISSGAIESYVLGLSSADEMRETESLAKLHPEVRQAIADFEIALEKEALKNAVQPDESLKERIMAALRQEGMQKVNGLLAVPPAETKAKVIPIAPAPKSVRWLQGAIAASIILLLGSAILNFYFYSKYKTFNGKYKELLAQNNTILAKNQALQASYDMMRDTAMIQAPAEEVEENLAMFSDSSMIKVAMKGSDTKKGSMATVLWDMKTKDVYLVVNNLPKSPADKQYQLWALVDGKPVDAGMVDLSRPDGILKMHNIPKAQAFAITLEKKGGSAGPDLTQLYVIGKV